MNHLRASDFCKGDKVLIQAGPTRGYWTPARVIDTSATRVRVAYSRRVMDRFSCPTRWIPPGTPTVANQFLGRPYIKDDHIRLVERDPRWDPYAIQPFMDPPDFAQLGGIPGFMVASPGFQHIGAYNRGSDYYPGDPVWAWERSDGWHPAVVIDGIRSWVQVRFEFGYVSPEGRRSKAYRPAKIWPTICDFPEPVTKVDVPDEWRAIVDFEWALNRHEMGRYKSRLGRNPGL